MLAFEEKPVYLCCAFTDMRKSVNGLSTIVVADFSMNPQTEAIFVFCNKSRNRIKILEWDEDGFWIYYKSLEHSHVPWPVPDSKSMVISSNELVTLINSAKLVKKLKGQISGQVIL